MPQLTSPTIASGWLSRSVRPSIAVGQVAVVRPWTLADAPAVKDAFDDPEIQRWHVRAADSVDEVREWITAWQQGWCDESRLNWALADRDGGVVLGCVSLKGIDRRNGTAGVAYWMMPAARGRGLCSQAVVVLCACAFREVSTSAV